MAAGFSIRPATNDDYEAVCIVHTASILGLGPPTYSAAQCQSWAAGITPDLYRKAADEGERYLVACDPGGGVIGFSSTRDDRIMAVYVHPDRACQGVGSALLMRAETVIRDDGFDRAKLTASLNGLGFYRAKGYVECARSVFVSRGGGELDVADLEKPLK